MPLHDDYLRDIRSEVADVANSSDSGGGVDHGRAVPARVHRRRRAARWAHIDMSAPSWADTADGELAKGATGWGVRTLLRWLTTLSETR